MNLASSRFSPGRILSGIRPRPGLLFGFIIVMALAAFEVFNYSTTDYALNDLLGTLKFAGMQWSTILAIAFCAIDFAGIARLFTPEQGTDEPKEVWYLFGAWLLAATMNAILTWWGVSMAIVNHPARSVAIVDHNTLTKVIPIFVAVMVWVIRILIIGTISVAGERLFSTERRGAGSRVRTSMPISTAAGSSLPAQSYSPRPAISRPIMPRPVSPIEATSARPEPTYHTLAARHAASRAVVNEPSRGGDSSRNL